MLIRPNLKDEEIITCLQDAYGLNSEGVFFLPLGADLMTALYRIRTHSAKEYFLKLRNNKHIPACVLVPKYLSDNGFKQVIPPLETTTGNLWTNLSSFKAILYPYIEGFNGNETGMSDQQWIEFGSALKRFHSTYFPKVITKSIPRETFSSKWRKKVKTFLRCIEDEIFQEHVAIEMALFLKSKSSELLKIIKRTEDLADFLKNEPLPYILCHADIHGWNLLIEKEGALYIVDWDTLIFAPKERDLMFIGAGLGNESRPFSEVETLFYQGYGQTTLNQNALTYYRYERIIQDIAVYCEQIFLSNEGGEERVRSFEYVQSNFLPNGTIERAYGSDKMRESL
ncbi:MAG: aminoglycoside phosphotransferase family protein [Proteobacteria bacterium]|nr:aminoglycoside phosphotransferase family protein [Pseudomonadota bacterium]